MITKRIKCLFCDASYKSKFCISLHQRLHQENNKDSAEFGCKFCKKRFLKLVSYQWHLYYHGYSVLVSSSTQTNKKESATQTNEKNDCKLELIHVFSLFR